MLPVKSFPFSYKNNNNRNPTIFYEAMIVIPERLVFAYKIIRVKMLIST